MKEIDHKQCYILAADAVGFSKLVSQNEASTLKELRICFAIFTKAIDAFNGRIFHSAGDSIFAEFSSANAAVRAAIQAQKEIFNQTKTRSDKSGLVFRVGIDCGEVRIDGDNLLGEAVNFAARLESFAQHGGISISKAIRRELDDYKLSFTNHGLIKIKNSNIHAYDIRLNNLAIRKFLTPFNKALLSGFIALFVIAVSIVVYNQYFSKDDRYFRIAVIPFQNSSTNQEFEYVAIGLSNEITQSLSVISNLNLISRSSASQYRGSNLDFEQVKDDLDLTHLVEGNFTLSGGNVRLEISMHDFGNGETRKLISLDEPLSRLLESKDKIVEQVIKGLDIRLSKADREKVYYVDTVDMRAFEEFLKGDHQFGLRTASSREAAIGHFHKAIRLDPTFARAYGYLAILNASLVDQLFAVEISPQEKNRAKQLSEIFARAAIVIGPNVPEVNFARAFVSNFIERDYASALTFVNHAIDLNPNYADAVALRAILENRTDPEKGLKSITESISMNPLYTVEYLAIKAQAFAKMGRFQELKDISDSMLEREPNFIMGHMHLILAEKKLGTREDVAWAIEELLMVNPQFSLTEYYKNRGNLNSYKVYKEIFDYVGVPTKHH